MCILFNYKYKAFIAMIIANKLNRCILLSVFRNFNEENELRISVIKKTLI